MDACNLDTVCLGDFCSCGNITVNIQNVPIGTYNVVAKFNGVQVAQMVDVITENVLVLRNIFNENYTHLIRIVDVNNNIVNNTWYSLNIVPCLSSSETVEGEYNPASYNLSDYF